jgi:hypothetical protein
MTPRTVKQAAFVPAESDLYNLAVHHRQSFTEATPAANRYE